METAAPSTMTLSERADALEKQLSDELDRATIPVKAPLYTSGERDPRLPLEIQSDRPEFKGKKFNMGHDARLPKMPDKPTLLDFFELRMAPATHLLQSATHALKAGCEEKIIMACLVHDMAVSMFIRGDHGYWGAQLLEPYVDEEVSWAIRYHQCLRFYADESVGYPYPDAYVRMFGADYVPEPYIQADYERTKKHKWYMSARMICVNDLYSFDPAVVVTWQQFEDII